ncbi:putative fruit bromelain [Helianthus anomalus]
MSAIDSDREKFLAWKGEWGKEYPTKEEDESRFQTFKQNLREIEAFNSRSSARWWKGLNMFSDLTDEQFKTEFLGCKHPTMYKDVGGDEVMCWGSSSDDEEDTEEGHAAVKCQGPAAPPKEAILPEEPKPKRHRLDDSLLVPEDQFLTQHPVMAEK